MTESSFYIRFLESTDDRLDFNYNNPAYDIIDSLLANARYEPVELGKQRMLTKIASGKTPKGIHYLEENGIPFLGATQITDNKVFIDDAPLISEELHQGKLKDSQIKKDDVLVTIAGTYIGRCATFDINEECNCNQAIAILRVNNEETVSEFLSKYLNSRIGQLFFGKFQHESNQSNINLEEIQRIKIVLPQKNQQVSILDEVKVIESEADRLENEAKEARLLAEQTLFSELGITLQKEEKIDYYSYFFKDGFENQLSFGRNHPSMEKLQYSLENAKYAVKPLSKLVTLSYDSVEPRKYPDREYCYVGLENIESGTGRLKNIQLLKGSEIYSKSNVLKKDHLLFSGLRPYLDKCFILTEYDEAIGSAELFVCKIAENVCPDFLKWYLLSEAVLRQTKWILTGASYPRLDETDFLNLKIVIPEEFDEQKRISNIVNARIEESELKEQMARDRTQLANKTFEQLILNQLTNE